MAKGLKPRKLPYITMTKTVSNIPIGTLFAPWKKLTNFRITRGGGCPRAKLHQVVDCSTYKWYILGCPSPSLLGIFPFVSSGGPIPTCSHITSLWGSCWIGSSLKKRVFWTYCHHSGLHNLVQHRPKYHPHPTSPKNTVLYILVKDVYCKCMELEKMTLK